MTVSSCLLVLKHLLRQGYLNIETSLWQDIEKSTQKQANMTVTEAIWPKEEPCFSCKLCRHDERVSTGETEASSLVAIQGKGLVTKSRREGGKIRKIFFPDLQDF